MTNALEVAGYIMKTAGTNGNTQLNKLVYYCQAWSLVWTGRPLFSDPIEAWKDGPVVRAVYREGTHGQIPTDASLTDDQMKIVNSVVAFYSNKSGAELSSLTHSEDPWVEARGGLPSAAQSQSPISRRTMLTYYTRATVDKETPLCPSLGVTANAASVAEVGRRQRIRWREALDVLAVQ
ncbi:hypothetical protein GCM10022198_00580 [Klugiella xanthotipulae]|uniref:Putative phage-associated protein n=1 Tax=Klugiella xanthotipulae TaxID=244735 RepID=A0A543I5C3_9MICO|nr:type II toxin-antitoxin system antitoxin SocA domain-containing protein [Klugiella xanthotipulae]TQM65803.1 putative phage-associated protein [Klugiella xanthotipulae]